MYNLLGYSTLKEDHKSHSSHPSLYSGTGVIGTNQNNGAPESQHSIISLENQNLSPGSYQAPAKDGEDLYTWMAKQQDFVDATNETVEPGIVNKAAYWVSNKH